MPGVLRARNLTAKRRYCCTHGVWETTSPWKQIPDGPQWKISLVSHVGGTNISLLEKLKFQEDNCFKAYSLWKGWHLDDRSRCVFDRGCFSGVAQRSQFLKKSFELLEALYLSYIPNNVSMLTPQLKHVPPNTCIYIKIALQVNFGTSRSLDPS